MTPKSEFGSRVKFFFWKFSLEMIEFILIRNPNEILRVKLSKLGFHFQNFIPYKKQPKSLANIDIMLERKPWKRPKKGRKIPREKTDRDQTEPLLLSPHSTLK